MVLTVGYDLQVFFTTVNLPPERATTPDAAAFIPSQRSSGRPRLYVAAEDIAGVSARTLRMRLSSISGLFAFLQARRACRRGGNGSGRGRACRWQM
jgi:hypothetical protein